MVFKFLLKTLFLVLRSLGGAPEVPVREKGENWPIKELSQKAAELT